MQLGKASDKHMEQDLIPCRYKLKSMPIQKQLHKFGVFGFFPSHSFDYVETGSEISHPAPT